MGLTLDVWWCAVREMSVKELGARLASLRCLARLQRSWIPSFLFVHNHGIAILSLSVFNACAVKDPGNISGNCVILFSSVSQSTSLSWVLSVCSTAYNLFSYHSESFIGTVLLHTWTQRVLEYVSWWYTKKLSRYRQLQQSILIWGSAASGKPAPESAILIGQPLTNCFCCHMTGSLKAAQIGNRAQCQGSEDHAHLQSCRSRLRLLNPKILSFIY